MFRVLCTGDVHIGRRISRVPDVFRTSDAWSAVVDLAIAEQVNLLAISGDLIDKEGKSYEAFGPLESGLERLAEVGIPVVAVSGNHDFDILHRVAGTLISSGLRVLGRNGQWERATYTSADGNQQLHVDGWSFDAEHVTDSPLRTYPVGDSDGIPVLGLLHGDVGVPTSRYAPIALNGLWSAPVDLWLLGHIHASSELQSQDGRRAIYPGSPWAMDPGERGSHGVYIATFAGATLVSLERRNTSPVLFTTGQVDVAGIESQSDLFESIMLALQGLGQVASEHHGESLRVVSCRLHLVGRTARLHEIGVWAHNAETTAEPVPVGGNVIVLLDRLILDARPAIDLEELSRSMDPAGELARLIISLDSPEPQDLKAEQVLRSASASVDTVWQNSAYLPLQDGEGASGMPDVKDLVLEQAWVLLSTLVAQREQA